MKHGLKVALMTVAGTLLGLQAMAMAPTILDIPSPVVGSTGAGTDATPYVFGDAIDLNSPTVVSDDQTLNKDLIWSYEIVDSKKLYAINGKDPISQAQTSPNTPGAGQINNSVDPRETVNLDGKANTITIRNINLKPFTGTGATPSGNGIIDAQLVTLYASDGQAFDSQQVWFYTEQGGDDHLSVPTPTATWTKVLERKFDGGQEGWTYADGGGFGAATSGTKGNTALCINSPASNGGIFQWTSPYGELPLVKNAVYHFRLTMNFTQGSAQAPTNPFWDFNILNMDAAFYPNVYGGQFMNLDNEGGSGQGATAVPNGGAATNIDYYWAPAPVLNDAWNNGPMFNAANASKTGAKLVFRVMDLDPEYTINGSKVAGNPGITALNDSGTLCLDNLLIERTDMASVQASGAASYDAQNLTASNCNVKPFWTGGDATVATYASGKMTVKANGLGQQVEVAMVSPGPQQETAANPAGLPNNFPAVWDANSIYMVTFKLAAENTTAEQNTFDAILVGADVPTNEMISLNLVASSADQYKFCGHPKAGTAQSYVAFFHTKDVTKSGIQNAKRIRPRMDLLNNQNLVQGNNTGGLLVSGITVQKVTFQ